MIAEDRLAGDPDGRDIRPDWIPASRYRDPDLPRLERERLWPKVWQMACRESELTTRGSFVNYEILDDSILIVKTGDGPDDVLAYYNVCQHRGRKLREEYKGNFGDRISCRFHGWQWTIDGKNSHVHQHDDWSGCRQFDKDSLGLQKVRVERWGGWIWINQDQDAESLSEFLGVVPDMLDPFEPEAMHPLWWKTIDAPVNWKIVVEAFNESYHATNTHSSFMAYSIRCPASAFGRHAMFRILPSGAPVRYLDEANKWVVATSVAETIWAAHRVTNETLFALTLEPTMEAARRLRAEAKDDDPPEYLIDRFWALQQDEFAQRGLQWPRNLTPEAIHKAGDDWHIFPNSIVLPTVDGALWYRIRPHRSDPDRCIFDIWSLGRFPPDGQPAVENELYAGFAAFSGQNPFLEEDFQNMEAVSKGTKMRGWNGARTNPVEEITVNNFHRQLDEYITRPDRTSF